jgi:hypothetical protein
MELASRDRAIQNMQNIILEKKRFLNDKYRELHKVKKENPLIEIIMDDYDNYYTALNSQKEDQYSKLQLLTEYLDGMALGENTSESMLTQIKQDQQHILKEMEKIKTSL